MGATLDALRELQEIELQLVDIRRQLASKERLVTRQSAASKAAEDAIAAEKVELRKAQMAVDELDVDLKARRAQVAKHRESLNSVRTNKEYAAILSQLNTEKADEKRVEDRAYELMAVVDGHKKVLAERDQTLQVENNRLQAARQQLEQAQRLFAERLGALQKERDAAGAKLGKDALELFNRVSERYDGEVMAKVIRVNPRRDEYLCDGCNMSLAAERANTLMTRDELITCDNCGRLLYIER